MQPEACSTHPLHVACIQEIHPEHFSLFKKIELNFVSFKSDSSPVTIERTRGNESDVFRITNQEHKQKSHLLVSLFVSLKITIFAQNVQSPPLNLYTNEKSCSAFCTQNKGSGALWDFAILIMKGQLISCSHTPSQNIHRERLSAPFSNFLLKFT